MRVRSPSDRIVFSIIDGNQRSSGAGNHRRPVGTVELPVASSEKLLNNREVALDVMAIDCSADESSDSAPRRVIVGLLQIAAMWESSIVA